MWIRGEGLGLSWQEGRPVEKFAKDTWEITLKFRTSQDSYRCQDSRRVGMCNKFEFRIRTGQDKTDMLGANFAFSLPISKWSLTFKQAPTVTVYPWFFRQEGEVRSERVESPELGEKRPILVYLPPSFRENVYKPYDVLFLNDGQLMDFKLTNFLQLGAKMAVQRLLKEFILVGVTNNETERTSLLTPSNGTELACKNGTLANLCNHCNISCWQNTPPLNCTAAEKLAQVLKCFKSVPKVARGEEYLDFIQKTLLSHVHLQYRAQTQQQHVGIIGYSLGGLISCHAAWTRPTVFGLAACSSPSFWWPVPPGKEYPIDAEFEFINKTLSKFQDKRPFQKIYIDMGSYEDKILMLEPSKRAAGIMASTPYFDLDRNLWLQILDKQVHSGTAFIRRMWLPLYTLYAPKGSAKAGNTEVISGACAASLPVKAMFALFLALLTIYRFELC